MTHTRASLDSIVEAQGAEPRRPSVANGCPELFSDSGKLGGDSATDQRTNDAQGVRSQGKHVLEELTRHRGGIASAEGEHIVQAPCVLAGLLGERSLEQRWKIGEMVVDQLTTYPCFLGHRHHGQPVQPVSGDQA